MFFRRNKPVDKNLGAPPPWENIDNVPKLVHEKTKFDLIAFTKAATGFGSFGSRSILLIFALGLGFLTYVLYDISQTGPPLPPSHDRPAIDQYASSSNYRI